jgi:hypothetical protein
MGLVNGEAAALAILCGLVVVEGATDDIEDLTDEEFDDDSWTLPRMTREEGEEERVVVARDVKGDPEEGIWWLVDGNVGCGLASRPRVGISLVVIRRSGS